MLSSRKREIVAGYVFLLPWIIGFCIFNAGPLIASFIFSFCHYDIIHPLEFSGLRNYQILFLEDPVFWKSLNVTIQYVLLTVAPSLVLALAIALLLNRMTKGRNIFTTLFYLPAVLSGVAISIVWGWVFQPEFGIINDFLYKFHIKGPNWLSSEQWVIPSLVIVNVWWRTGMPMIIFLAGLQNIPSQLYEAAEVDGANIFQKFWRITIPMLTPIIFYNLIITIILTFQLFAPVYILTRGGPSYSSLVYVLYLYFSGWEWLKFGYASALAWVLFIIILAFTLALFKSSPFWVFYQGVKGK